MKKSPYDNETFFEKYSQMDRSRLGLAGAGEWESLEPLLPDFAGKRVLDLGCGYGWHCIYAAEHGAASVTGVDLSEKMLAVAREKTAAPQVTYLRGDMGAVEFPPESFDVVLSSLAIHYLPSFGSPGKYKPFPAYQSSGDLSREQKVIPPQNVVEIVGIF